MSNGTDTHPFFIHPSQRGIGDIFLFDAAMKATDRHKLIDRIKTLEGLTDDERSALLSLLRENKTYGLVWEDKPEEVEERLRTGLPVLVEVKDRALTSAGPDAPNHILIEGDNLEALTTLAYTHAGKIDVIYIDPPYNTGNKDFIYNDSYVDSEDSYRHSKWLSFMSRRLKIAKKLLSDRGVIFISIDDNEQAQLKLLCDEIFRGNFIGLISRATGTTTGQDTGSLGKACDYMLVYSKYPNYQLGGIPLTNDDIGRYSMEDCNGRFSILQLRRTGGEDRREDRPTMFFPIIAPDGSEIFPYGPTGYESRWRVGPKKVEEMIKENLLFFKKDKSGNWKVYYKFYAENKTKRPSNLWIDIEGNKKAQIEVKNVLGERAFSTPKPMDLITKILQITDSQNSTILDFFAGSGTTLHAVMQLNAEDGGKRTCILCTNNENGICENVTYERNKRVIQGYTKPNGDFVEGLHDNNLRYYRTDFVSRDRTQKNRRELMEKSTALLCIKENLYTEQATFGRIKLNPKGARFFESGDRRMLIIHHPEFIPFFVNEIEKMDIDVPIKVYVYSAGKYAYNDEFYAVEEKVSLCALPQNIIDAMARVLPERATEKELKAAASVIEAAPVTEEKREIDSTSLFDFTESEAE